MEPEQISPSSSSSSAGSEALLPVPALFQQLATHFGALHEPRRAHRRVHGLLDIVAITLCAALCGVRDFEHIEEFGHSHQRWLRQFLPLAGGVPSHDTFRRLFSLLDAAQFEEAFRGWVQALSATLRTANLPAALVTVDAAGGSGGGSGTCHPGEGAPPTQVCLDGKSLRGSASAGRGRGALHLVHAWSTQRGLLLGQVAVSEKSNEISALP